MAEANPNSRLEAFCDGVFAIALTLLIIDIKIPSTVEITTVSDFWLALRHIIPSIAAFVLSFIVILITWLNHHQSFKLIHKSSPSFVFANGFLLLAVVLLPFPTALLGEYVLTDHSSPAVILYTATLVLQAIGWILTYSAILKNNLGKSEEANTQMRKNRMYGYYSFIVYSLLGFLAIWFPLSVAFITVLLWLFWLWLSVNMKHAGMD